MGSKRKVILNNASNFAFALGQRAFLKEDVAAAERRGERLALLWYRFDKKHRERTYRNLQMAFPDWSEEKLNETGLEVFRHFGRVTADFMRTPIRTKEEVLDAEVEGMDILRQVHAEGKGVMIITAHYGNWERFAHWFTVNGFTLNVVARDANQGGVNDRVKALREAAGANVMSRGNSARAILGRLKVGDLVGILNDQNAGDCYVPFFGKPCGTVLGPAVLHLRTGAPLIPSYFTRLGPGKYKAKFFEPVLADDFERDQIKITARLNEILEGVVRENPEQWLWMHDRWKSARQEGLL